MKITIIETGRPPGGLREQFSDYPSMFEALLSRADRGFSFETVRLLDGHAPPPPETLDAALITGSPFGVYDDTPWMNPLRDFIRAAFVLKTPMVGVCFGHQIIADAMGGDVGKSDKGWGLGRHTYALLAHEPWMGETADTASFAVSHQDQVHAPPPNARTIARSAHTEHAALVYEDAPVMTVQGHPEFDDTFAAALYTLRAGKAFPEDTAHAAVASLAAPHDNPRTARWMANFFQAGQKTQR